jgi:Family of unknown function (DUF5985)
MNGVAINSFLSGAIALAAIAIALFFFRFQQATKDRLFGFFAIAFLLLGFEQVCVAFLSDRLQAHVYLIRLLAFLLILAGIFDKNRQRK